MKQYRKYFTEATLASVAVVYFYLVYLIGETGRLNAYGIYDTNSLITLEVQNIIIGFLSSVFYFAIFIVLFIIVLKPFSFNIEKLSEKQRKNRKKHGSFLVTTLATLIFLLLFKNEMGLTISIFSGAIIIVFSWFFHYGKSKNRRQTLHDTLDSRLTRLIFKDDPNMDSKSLTRLLIATIPLVLVLIPMINYFVNFSSVHSSPYATILLTERDNGQYILARQYSDKNILVRIAKGKLIPEFLILRGEAMDTTQFRSVSMKIDSSSLSPKPEPILKLDKQTEDFIRNIF